MRSRSLRSVRHAPPFRSRAGAVIIWLIIAAPVLMIMVVAVIDLSNQSAARNELEHALEAAALAAVETWGKNQPNSATSRTNARTAGVNFALANNVRGQPLVITTNGGGGGTNNNSSCSGNLVLGGMTTSAGAVTFNAGSDPGCGRSTSLTVNFGVDITVTTDPAGSTFNDPNVFQFDFTSSDTSGFWIKSIQIDLRGHGDTDATWDLEVPTAANDVSGGYGPVTGTLSGLVAGNITYVPDGSTHTTPSVLTINFATNTFNVGDSFNFGADTEMMGVCAAALQDRGGAFGAGNAGAPMGCDEVGARFTVTFSDGTNDLTVTSLSPITRLGPNSSSLIGQTGSGSFTVIVPDIDFAVKAQGSVTVPSMWNSIFGVTIGPSRVAATSFARFPCTTGPAKIQRADTVICP